MFHSYRFVDFTIISLLSQLGKWWVNVWLTHFWYYAAHHRHCLLNVWSNTASELNHDDFVSSNKQKETILYWIVGQWSISLSTHKARAWNSKFWKEALGGKFLKKIHFYIIFKIKRKLCIGAFEFSFQTQNVST